MDIGGLDAVSPQVLVQFLRHPFGQGGHEHSFVAMDACPDLVHQVVHLVLRRTHFDLRIQQSCRSDQLVYHDTFRAVQFILVRRGGDEDS